MTGHVTTEMETQMMDWKKNSLKMRKTELKLGACCQGVDKKWFCSISSISKTSAG